MRPRWGRFMLTADGQDVKTPKGSHYIKRCTRYTDPGGVALSFLPIGRCTDPGGVALSFLSIGRCDPAGVGQKIQFLLMECDRAAVISCWCHFSNRMRPRCGLFLSMSFFRWLECDHAVVFSCRCHSSGGWNVTALRSFLVDVILQVDGM